VGGSSGSGWGGAAGTGGTAGAGGTAGTGGIAGADSGSDVAVDAPLASEMYAAEVLADAPLLYWRLDELSGLSVDDASGNGNDGFVIDTIAWNASGAMVGSTAAEFGGGRIESTDGFDFTGTAPFSLEAWVQPVGVQVQYARLLSKDTNTGGIRQGWDVLFDNESIQFERWLDGSGSFANAVFPDDGGFFHLTVTYDGTEMKLYIDGVEKGSTGSTKSLPDTTKPFTLGAYNGTSNAFAGVLDEIAVYDHVLTLPRIQAHVVAANP
jgi:hypothetical protein